MLIKEILTESSSSKPSINVNLDYSGVHVSTQSMPTINIKSDELSKAAFKIYKLPNHEEVLTQFEQILNDANQELGGKLQSLAESYYATLYAISANNLENATQKIQQLVDQKAKDIE